MYAVKANDSPGLLPELYRCGITWFDVASIGEVRHVRHLLPEAALCFMNPVQAPAEIRAAYSLGGAGV